MKKIFIIPALIIAVYWTTPIQALSAEPGIAEILASLNQKTDKVKVEWQQENKQQKTVSNFVEVNTYVFSVEDGNKLKIELDEKVENFVGDKLSRSHHTSGNIVFDAKAIDPESPIYNQEMIEIHCKEDKNCAIPKVEVTRKITDLNKEFSQTRETPTFMFQVRAHYDQEKDKPIFEDLKKLVSLLAPPPPTETGGNPSTSEKDGT